MRGEWNNLFSEFFCAVKTALADLNSFWGVEQGFLVEGEEDLVVSITEDSVKESSGVGLRELRFCVFCGVCVGVVGFESEFKPEKRFLVETDFWGKKVWTEG